MGASRDGPVGPFSGASGLGLAVEYREGGSNVNLSMDTVLDICKRYGKLGSAGQDVLESALNRDLGYENTTPSLVEEARSFLELLAVEFPAEAGVACEAESTAEYCAEYLANEPEDGEEWGELEWTEWGLGWSGARGG